MTYRWGSPVRLDIFKCMAVTMLGDVGGGTLRVAEDLEKKQKLNLRGQATFGEQVEGKAFRDSWWSVRSSLCCRTRGGLRSPLMFL